MIYFDEKQDLHMPDNYNKDKQLYWYLNERRMGKWYRRKDCHPDNLNQYPEN